MTRRQACIAGGPCLISKYSQHRATGLNKERAAGFEHTEENVADRGERKRTGKMQ